MAVVAHIDPKTYRVLGIDYTKDYEMMWNNRAAKKTLPIVIIGASGIMDRLDKTSPNPYAPYMPELKDLSINLLMLLGHPRDIAERWIGEDSEGETVYAQIGLEAILQTLYATFTVLADGEGKDENDRPDLPKYDNEPLDQFRSDLRAFISDLNYVHRDLTIGDLLG